jgi:hypothetical protein
MTMPFDPEIPLRDTPTVHPRWREIATLHNMKARLSNPDQWCRGRLFDGAASCLVGSLWLSNGIADPTEWSQMPISGQQIYDRLRKLTARRDVASFNDDPAVSHDDVMGLLEMALQSFEMES